MANQPSSVKIQEPSRFLIAISMLCLPGMYIILIACALAALAGVYYAFNGMIYLFTETRPGSSIAFRVGLLIGLMGLGALICAFGCVRGLAATLIHKRPFEPCIIIPPAKYIGLNQLLIKLCSAMNTRKPDTIVLHPEPVFFVTQGKFQAFNGVAKGRVLAIGVPCLGGMTVNELRSVLAHEFAHFTGNDLTYSACALPIYKGAATAYFAMDDAINAVDSTAIRIPMYLPHAIIKAFVDEFEKLDMKLSRQREFRADAVAAGTCGSESFKRGLMKVVAISRSFGDDNAMSLVKKVDSQNPSTNLLTAFRKALPQLRDIAYQHYQDALAVKESTRDTHPTLSGRMAALPQVSDRYQDTAVAATLIDDIEQHEEMLSGLMSKLVQATAHRH